jgi:hypothetical protein
MSRDLTPRQSACKRQNWRLESYCNVQLARGGVGINFQAQFYPRDKILKFLGREEVEKVLLCTCSDCCPFPLLFPTIISTSRAPSLWDLIYNSCLLRPTSSAWLPLQLDLAQARYAEQAVDLLDHIDEQEFSTRQPANLSPDHTIIAVSASKSDSLSRRSRYSGRKVVHSTTVKA